MRRTQRQLSPLPCIVALLLIGAGCGPFGGPEKTNRIVSTPPPPIPSIELDRLVFPEAARDQVEPRIDWVIRNLYSVEVGSALQEARGRFRAGERYYEEGDFHNARILFDRSIDALLETPADALDRYRVERVYAELIPAIHRYDVESHGASDPEPGFEAAPLDGLLAATFPVDPNVEMNVIERLELPVSELPIDVNGEVARYINYFSTTGGRRTLVRGLRRLGRYKPMIQRILEEEGVPKELMYLPLVESAYNPRALSRYRAAGMWQFMRSRGGEYGLHRTSYYDDRLDPEKATRAGARHLRDLYEYLGDWYLAMAAYNAGPLRVHQAVRRTGYADYWEFVRRKALPRATRKYVPLILAAVIMSSAPDEYGLDVVPDPPLEYNTIEVTADTHLGLIADILGRPLADLRTLNPALLKDIAPAGYAVRVPKGTGRFVMAAVDTVPASRRDAWRVHRVSHGETLSQIAGYYETTAEKIFVANGGAVTEPEAGDFVVVPVSYSPVRGVSGSRARRPAGKKRSVSESTRSKSISSGG